MLAVPARTSDISGDIRIISLWTRPCRDLHRIVRLCVDIQIRDIKTDPACRAAIVPGIRSANDRLIVIAPNPGDMVTLFARHRINPEACDFAGDRRPKDRPEFVGYSVKINVLSDFCVWPDGLQPSG